MTINPNPKKPLQFFHHQNLKKMPQLKVGDKIAENYHGRPTSILEVCRVTKTQAVCPRGNSEIKFKIDYPGEGWSAGHLNEIGREQWSNTSYRIAAEKDFEAIQKAKNIAVVKKFDFETLTTEQLSKIIKILKNER